MASITYKLSNKIGADGKSQIIVWIKVDRILQMQIQSGIYVLPIHFEVMGTNGGAKYGTIKVPNKRKLNFDEVTDTTKAKNRLQDYTNKLLRVIEVVPPEELTKELIKNAASLFDSITLQELNFAVLKERIEEKQTTEEKQTFFSYLGVFLKERNLAETEVRNYKVLFRCLQRWQGYKQAIEPKRKFTIEMDSITDDNILDFRDYMRNESQLQTELPELYKTLTDKYPIEIERESRKHPNAVIKPRSENYLIKMMTRLKTFWLWLIKKELTTNNPFSNVEIGKAIYGVPFYLTIDERNKLAEYDLSDRPYLAVQRDIFVFQCLIGCRVSDLYKLTKANITDGILEYVPIKTRDNEKQVKPRIPLNKRAIELIKRYDGHDLKGRLFPFISTQKYNDAIKEALKICGINRNVQVRNALTGLTEVRPIYEVASSHMARRTFVGTAYSKVQDPNLIGKMSGHVEGSRAFARYRAIDDDLLKNVINLID